MPLSRREWLLGIRVVREGDDLIVTLGLGLLFMRATFDVSRRHA